jgi:small subunit ribosomal protein S21
VQRWVGDVLMPGVVVRENEQFEDAYRRFKKQTDRNLVVTECRARRFFESNVEKKKKQKMLARKKQLKRLYMMRRYESRL